MCCSVYLADMIQIALWRRTINTPIEMTIVAANLYGETGLILEPAACECLLLKLSKADFLGIHVPLGLWKREQTRMKISGHNATRNNKRGKNNKCVRETSLWIHSCGYFIIVFECANTGNTGKACTVHSLAPSYTPCRCSFVCASLKRISKNWRLHLGVQLEPKYLNSN